MALVVISDLHIQSEQDPTYFSLIKILNERLSPNDDLVLAGDLFDLFVGNKGVFTARYSDLISTLKKVGQKGVKIHYIEGNHDFLLEGAFKSIPNFKLYAEKVLINTDKHRVYVAHGDLVDKTNIPYRMLRAFFRSPFMKAFVKLAPDRWIEGIGTTSSKSSRKKKPLLPAELPRENLQRLRRKYRNFSVDRFNEGFDMVVLGHCHDLDEFRFVMGERKTQYINMGFPPVHGSYLELGPEDDAFKRIPMPEGHG